MVHLPKNQPFNAEKISVQSAQELLDLLLHKNIYFSCGYGGVMFIEMGNIAEHRIEYEVGSFHTRKYGEYRLFTTEDWAFSDEKSKHITRWKSNSAECDELFESLGIQTIEKIEIINNFEKTIFHITGGYTFTILKVDCIDTFSINFIPQQKELRVYGNGDIVLADNYTERNHLKEYKPRPKSTPTITIDKSFLRNQVFDELPLSYEKAQELTHRVCNQQIRTVEANSGTRCTLGLGEDFRKLLRSEDKKFHKDPIYQWSLSIDEVWVLKKKNGVVLDVREKRFNFLAELTELLSGAYIKEFTYDHDGSNAVIVLSDESRLSIVDSGRYSRWSLFDFTTGMTVIANRDNGLEYRISSPLNSVGKYNTGDWNLDSILYQLRFYRKYFAGDIEIE